MCEAHALASRTRAVLPVLPVASSMGGVFISNEHTQMVKDQEAPQVSEETLRGPTSLSMDQRDAHDTDDSVLDLSFIALVLFP